MGRAWKVCRGEGVYGGVGGLILRGTSLFSEEKGRRNKGRICVRGTWKKGGD